jgi:hypothetical protein
MTVGSNRIVNNNTSFTNKHPLPLVRLRFPVADHKNVNNYSFKLIL